LKYLKNYLYILKKKKKKCFGDDDPNPNVENTLEFLDEEVLCDNRYEYCCDNIEHKIHMLQDDIEQKKRDIIKYM